MTGSRMRSTLPSPLPSMRLRGMFRKRSDSTLQQKSLPLFATFSDVADFKDEHSVHGINACNSNMNVIAQ
jgi:hypothetical protein